MTATANPQVIPLRAKLPSDPQWSDDAVALACGSGDPTAVAELFERFQNTVTRFLSRAANPGDVDDLVQATFLQIARGSAHFDGRSSVRTWLLAIASNVLRQHYRTNARRRKLLSALTLVEPSHTNSDLSSQVAARRDIEGVRAALSALPEPTRLAFLLCEVEGLSAREAAIILDANETTIWKRVSDARKRLLKAAGELRS